MERTRIVDFIKDVASSSPAPGGGAVAALSGALGVALTSMTYNLTLGKKCYNDLTEETKLKLNDNLKECEVLYMNILDYIEKDKEAFQSLVDCYKLPNESDDEKITRKEKIEKATVKAMNVPLELCRLSMKFMDNIDFASKYGNKNLISDVAISGIMLGACIDSSIINIEINLYSLKNKELFNKVKSELKNIKEENEELKLRSLNYVNNRIKI